MRAQFNYWNDNPAFYRYMKYWGSNKKRGDSLGELWTSNTFANKDRIVDYPSVHTLPNCLDKAVIVVGASPALKEDYRYLLDLPDHYIIICVNSALKFLLEHGVKPHYVIAVDGGIGIPGNLDVNGNHGNTTLLAANSVSPYAFEVWHGDVKIIPYNDVTDKDLKKWIKKTFGNPTPCGGNAFNSAAAIAVTVMKTSLVVFIANELSWRGKKYYADKPSFNDETLVFRARDVAKQWTYTNTVLYQYKIWLEAFCRQNSDVNFYNVSGGILGYSEMTGWINEIKQVPFETAKWEIDEGIRIYRDVAERERLKYNLAYSTDDYNPTVGKGAWGDIIDQKKFVRGLDVGCGPGYGVKMARDAGLDVYGVDISDNLQAKWKEQGIEDYCQTAPASKLPFQDNTFDITLCTEVMEHIPEELVTESLKEIRRVSCGQVYFSIAKRYIPKGGVWIAGKYQPHATVKPKRWWIGKLRENGFKVHKTMPIGTTSNLYICE